MSQKFNRSIFSKLYRYYCYKLLALWPYSLLFLLLAVLKFYLIFQSFSRGEGIDPQSSWQDFLWYFFNLFLGQFQAYFFLTILGITRLVGLSFNFSFKFQVPKRSNAEDIQIANLVPGVKRETIVNAKIAAIFTYFFGINFLLTLPLFFLFFSFLSPVVTFVFLITNGLFFCLVSFLLLVPYLFYFYENYSLLSVLIYFVIFLVVIAGGYLFQETIKSYPIIFTLAFFPFSLLVGYLLYSLYRHTFLKRDLC